MTTWYKTESKMQAEMNGREYEIHKSGAFYEVYCDGGLLSDGWGTLAAAQASAEAHAADDTPTQPKQGVHIDNIAGQQLVDILKRSFTTAQIQDLIDASPFDEPDTGAPEAQS